MIIRYLLAALAAGLLAGILMTPVQMTRIVPIILHAEEFEGEAPHDHPAMVDVKPDAAAASVESAAAVAHVHEHAATEAGDKAPFLLGRFWNTTIANLVSGAGFALLLAGISLVCGVNITVRTGLFWGAAGWMAFQFLPGLGLPPELPGFPEVDLQARQVWWLATVGSAIAAMLLLLLRKELIARVAAVALLVAPHIVGAPQPADISASVPAYLAAEFVMAALSTTLFFWLVLGLALGYFMERSEKLA